MNSFYHSTRGKSENVTSKQAILRGIAPDGGLYVADWVGEHKLDLAKICAQGFQETARDVLGTLLPDFTEDEIASCVEAAYGAQWDTPACCPVTPLGDDWLLELYHGPTSAFKDVALQMLPQLMGVARRGAEGEDKKIMIVTATSGDTGKAALEGFAGVDGCGVTVFYPEGKVSDIQHLQMATQKGDNVAVCAVRGNFDDCQTEVKRIFADHEMAERLAREGAVLSSANSINVGRLAPQVTYYFDAYAQLVRAGAVEQGDEVTFCVPTGNFGDVLAGYYAKRLGLMSASSSSPPTRTTCSPISSPPAPTTACDRSTRRSAPPWTSSSPLTSSACSTTSATATASSSPPSWATWRPRVPTPSPQRS